jgi:FkbM family methyltransferase
MGRDEQRTRIEHESEMKLKSAIKNTLLRFPLLDRVIRAWLSKPRQINVDGVSLTLADRSRSLSHAALLREFLADAYGLRAIDFAPGDVVVDIGAHVGVESVFLGKCHPSLRILAFEPVPENFASLEQNVSANGVRNVESFPSAVTGDAREVTIWVNLEENSGGGGHDRPESHFQGRTSFTVPSLTLDQIFAEHGIERCKLLKIDCEGAEHDILRSATCLDRVEYLSGEFHVDGHLRGQGHTIESLIDYCAQWIPRERMRIVRDEQ